MNADRIERAEAFHRVSDVLSCKWTLAVLEAIGRGVSRPSEILRELPGLSGKVLNQRLRKLEDFDLLTRSAFAETPPRVEYRLNDRGRELARVVELVNGFVDEWAGSETP